MYRSIFRYFESCKPIYLLSRPIIYTSSTFFNYTTSHVSSNNGPNIPPPTNTTDANLNLLEPTFLPSQLLSLLSNPTQKPEYIFSCFHSIKEQLPMMTAVPLFRLALKESNYEVARKVYAFHLPLSSEFLKIADWEQLFILSDSYGDFEGQKIFFASLVQAGLKPSISILHSHLSCGLVAVSINSESITTKSIMPLLSAGSMNPSGANQSSNEIKPASPFTWIVYILTVFKKFHCSLTPTTIEIILSHCVLHRNWKVVVELLNPSLNLYPFISDELFQFILYELGAERLPKLVASIWNGITLYYQNHSHSSLTVLNQIALDAIINGSDPSTASDGYKIYCKLLQSENSNSPPTTPNPFSKTKPITLPITYSSHPATLAAFGHRLCSFLLTSVRFDLLLSTLILLHRSSLNISTSLFFSAFDGIIQYSAKATEENAPVNPFEQLGTFITSFHQEIGSDALCPELRAALIKLSTRHSIPSSFLDTLERLELAR